MKTAYSHAPVSEDYIPHHIEDQGATAYAVVAEVE